MFPQVPRNTLITALQLENNNIDKAVDFILCEQQISGTIQCQWVIW